MRQKYTNAKILGKLTSNPQSTMEIVNSLTYTDKNGKTWTPASGTIVTKLNLLCQAGLVVRQSTMSNHATWYKTSTAGNWSYKGMKNRD